MRAIRIAWVLAIFLSTLHSAHAKTAFAYVANNLANTVSVVNTSTHLVVTTIPVGTFPYGVAVDQAGKFAYVTNSASNDVSVISGRVMEGLEHGYCWSVAVSRSDPDTVLLSASKSPRAAHSKEFANSCVYRRSAHEPWRKALDGLPDPKGRRVPVLAPSDIEPGVFYLASERELYRSADSGAAWQKLTVDWAQRCSQQRAGDIAVVES